MPSYKHALMQNIYHHISIIPPKMEKRLTLVHQKHDTDDPLRLHHGTEPGTAVPQRLRFQESAVRYPRVVQRQIYPTTASVSTKYRNLRYCRLT
jgi:hypothetical protein